MVYKTVEQTLFTGKQIISIDECSSTNTLALSLLQKNVTVADGTVVATLNQTAGRGQRGNSWVSDSKKNLTFSVIYKPIFLGLNDQFLLNVFSSLAIRDYVSKKIDAHTYVKWPNDVLVGDKKVAGILVENQVQANCIISSVIGVGINILQDFFSVEHAVSLKNITGKSYSLAKEFSEVISHVEMRYLQLKNQHGRLMTEYLNTLYRMGEWGFFEHNGNVFEGSIVGVDATGRLKIETALGIRFFDVKEIIYR